VTPTPTTPTPTPPAPKKPALYLSGRKLQIDLTVKPSARKKCPKVVTVAITTKAAKKRVKVKVRAGSKGCRIRGTVTLSSKVSKLKSVNVTITGSSIKTRRVKAARLP
jgi:hypothetical protein